MRTAKGFHPILWAGPPPLRDSASRVFFGMFAALALFASLLTCSQVGPLQPPELLQVVASQWHDERDQWKFTQRVREFDGDRLAEERLETYDPTRGESRRWALLEVNGHPPTQDEWDAWNRRKNRPRRRDVKPVTDYFDLDRARVVAETPRLIRYELPLRNTSWLIPSDKFAVTVTVDREQQTVRQARVRIDGPFNVALGLARVVDLDLDLRVTPRAAGEPAQPEGTAYAVVNKLGRRIEYSWTDFMRTGDVAMHSG